MFQFRRFPTCAYLIQRRLTEYCSAGFPHSEISGSTAICASPKLIAACHVLHRLLMPRHSPCALISLTYSPPSNRKTRKEISSFALPRPQEAEKLIWFSSSLSNYAGIELTKLSCFTLFSKSSTISFVSLCCLLFILWLLCSVFKVRLWLETRSKYSASAEHLNQSSSQPSQTSLPASLSPEKRLVEISGIEPLTPCLQSRCSPS